jgi:hypothetical protein
MPSVLRLNACIAFYVLNPRNPCGRHYLPYANPNASNIVSRYLADNSRGLWSSSTKVTCAADFRSCRAVQACALDNVWHSRSHRVLFLEIFRYISRLKHEDEPSGRVKSIVLDVCETEQMLKFDTVYEDVHPNIGSISCAPVQTCSEHCRSNNTMYRVLA